MPALLSFIARLLALAAGLVFAASLAAAAVLAAALLLLQAGWARLTGRPAPRVLSGLWRMRGFAGSAGSRRPAHGFAPQRVRVRADVTDVEPK
ncbi:hypothetical protein [Ramlibacter sp.]|uniref:hypothetical protein n=1 Tax=Ramlibacter sp. TaxID=1917967 RepID=UPI002FC905B3